MVNFSSNNSLAGTPQSMSTSYKTIVGLAASSATQARRGQIYDIMIGADGTPADNALVWDVSRQTVAGTGTTATAVPLNPADAAYLGLSLANYTVEPTVTAASSLFNIAINQRASYRWVAAPGSELVYPATTANGLVLRCKSATYTSTVTGHVLFSEI